MVEFTDREIKIIHGMGLLMNPMFQNVPPRVRETTFMMMLKIRNIDFTEDELKDIMLGIEAEQKEITNSGLGLVDKMGKHMKGIKDLKLKDIFG